ncbi:MAG TPA: hypothetical protein VD886_11695 [Herpetosiphonaceae bacterium]|nr:hypothetical protein [Herpetosiphonaceae bacterium]
MDVSQYAAFLALRDRGDKAGAAAAVSAFIASFGSFDERYDWVADFLEREFGGGKMRHEIYRDLVFPVLLAGYRRRDAWAVAWLARTCQNLYACRECRGLIGDTTEYALWLEAYRLRPDGETRAALLKQQIAWFRFSEHEWPRGILYGMNGATPAQCAEILAEVGFARELDTNGECTRFLDAYERKVRDYQGRLERSAP